MWQRNVNSLIKFWNAQTNQPFMATKLSLEHVINKANFDQRTKEVNDRLNNYLPVCGQTNTM